jgi:pyridoxal 5-phosphate dependent beta-lyase
VTVTDKALDAPWRAWSARRPPFAGVHLDAAAAGRASTEVLRAVAQHARRESEVGAYVAEAGASLSLEAGRAQLGALLGVPTDGVAFVESATAALQALLASWPLPEHPTVAVAPSEWGPNLRVFRMHGLEVRLLDVDDDGHVDIGALSDLLARHPPSLVHVDRVAAHRGLVQPVDEIVAACRVADVPAWVDAAQALGHIDAVSDADAVIATSRKWLCGPRGVGVLGIAERWWGRLNIEPLVLQPDRSVVGRLESDEANVAGRVGLCVAVQDYVSCCPAAVQHRLADIGSLARDTLADVPGWRLVPSTDPAAMVALLPTDGQDVIAERRRLLADHQILVTASQPSRAPLETMGATLRISPHVDTTDAQLDALARALALTRR